jgi:hypothetical protein
VGLLIYSSIDDELMLLGLLGYRELLNLQQGDISPCGEMSMLVHGNEQ